VAAAQVGQPSGRGTGRTWTGCAEPPTSLRIRCDGVDMRIRPTLATVVATSLLSSGFVLATSLSASAAPRPKAYKNCTELNKVYKHGVGRPGAKDKVSGRTKRVTSFTVSAATYKLNTKSDRDKDGIACEKR
jgi:hypothetical protein